MAEGNNAMPPHSSSSSRQPPNAAVAYQHQRRRDTTPSSSSSSSPLPPPPQIRSSAVVLLVSASCLLRILVGLHPHSGQGDDHGASSSVASGADDAGAAVPAVPAYGGDYEAQRHWMELTLHLPISEWYHHDVSYWGLDYPPLTAYVSWVCGLLSSLLVGEESVALGDSRGYEDETHKAYMRGTVLALDLAVYFPAVWVIAERLHPNDLRRRLWTVTLALAQPALVLIDHGHFQYNTTALGLALWSLHFMTKGADRDRSSSKIPEVARRSQCPPFLNCVWGSVLFCMSLNFKQMSLYYAPAVFSYLLGRCWGPKTVNPSFQRTRTLVTATRVSILGVTVIASFVALWWPFYVYPYTNGGKVQGDSVRSVLHVLRRLFPFQRGLFEGKVSNVWCALNVRPISIRRRVPDSVQPKLATLLTAALTLPACKYLFSAGRGAYAPNRRHCRAEEDGDDLRCLLLGATSVALAFFLASFQVHEKGILMVLSPLSMLIMDDASATPLPLFVGWFSAAAAWSLHPLLVVDRLNAAYACVCAVFFLATRWAWVENEVAVVCVARRVNDGSGGSTIDRVDLAQIRSQEIAVAVTVLLMLLLHLGEMLLDPPANLPDLFPVLWSLVGCAMFCWAWLFSLWVLAVAVARDSLISNLAERLFLLHW